MVTTMKLSDYVMDFLVTQGVRHVFAVSGGASLHLIHAAGDNPNITYITPHHEQAAAMSADGYARVSGKLGVAIATSGPGATNLITGIGCSYYDSIPVLYLTGQVSTFRMVGDTGVRQIGFQETPIVGMCKDITKYAVQITDPKMIRYELEKALYLAQTGRKGPVVVDIPDDIQRMSIEIDNLQAFIAHETLCESSADKHKKILEMLSRSERPIMVMGWGIHLSGGEAEALKFAETLGIPVALTWGAADIVPAEHPLYVGTFGTHGVRHVNFAVQNADLIISIGARLDTKATGTPINSFARDAKKIMVDIDIKELNKFPRFGLELDLLIHQDAKDFLLSMLKYDLKQNKKDYESWYQQIIHWKNEFGKFDEAKTTKEINPYLFFDNLSDNLPEECQIFIDTGCAIAWSMQRMRFKSGQRVYHDFNNTAMGWALPAAIGGYFARPELPLILIVGDGSFMMTMYELATIKHHKIPIKIFILNNSGYAMIRQTQDQWFNSKYCASSNEGGLSFPDFESIAKAFELSFLETQEQSSCNRIIHEAIGSDSALLCNVVIPASARVIPQVKFGRPNEDMEPILPRDVFNREMIIDILPSSKS